MVQEQRLEKQIEKQMGCMAGFFQLFDRHHVLSSKRLPPSPGSSDSSTPGSEKATSCDSPALSRELQKTVNNNSNQHKLQVRTTPSPDRSKPPASPVPELRSPVSDTQSMQLPLPLPLPLPIFELKEGTKSSWKFCKEAPRLSLDSRATFDPAKGGLKAREIRNSNVNVNGNANNNGEESESESEKQRKSTSVIARLMGLEPLPDSDPEPVKNPQLRRSASESRAHRDVFQYRYIDGVNFQLKTPQSQQPRNIKSNANAMRNGTGRNDVAATNGRAIDRREWNAARNVRADPKGASRGGNLRGMGQRKSFFDSADFFPEPKQTVSMIYNEIERRLKMRGIDEPSKDLETLKQILEALQLKGLLHSNTRPQSPPMPNANCSRNIVYNESPIIVMRPSRSPIRGVRIGTDSPPPKARPGGVRREYSPSPAVSPRPESDRNVRNQSRGRSMSSPTRSESGLRSPNRRRPLSAETQQRVSPVQSPRAGQRRTGAEQINGRSLTRSRRSTVESVPAEDELSTVSGSSISNSNSSHTDTERSSKVEEKKEGRNLLERCDKLLHSIAEMTATNTTELQQPSPVSVLDSSFYKEELSPSPVMKRRILDFKDQVIDSEDDLWNLPVSPIQLKVEEASDDCDYNYVSDILRASNYLSEESDVFLLLEKKQYLKGKDTSSVVSKLQRKLIFDTISEIRNRRRQLPPWKIVADSTKFEIGQDTSSLQQIWSEFQRIRERDVSDDVFEVICGVLKKDLAGDAVNGWGDSPIEMSEAVLDMERLIFKDLVSETIRDLAAFASNCNQISVLRRKLVF